MSSRGVKGAARAARVVVSVAALAATLATIAPAPPGRADGCDEGGCEAPPSLQGINDSNRQEKIRAWFEYTSEHAFDAINNAQTPWNTAEFYATWLSFYGLRPGPIGAQSSSSTLYTSGDRLETIALPGLNVSWGVGDRFIGQRLKHVGDPYSNFFADRGSGWLFDGGVPYIRMSYFVVNEDDVFVGCTGNSCIQYSTCTFLRRGSLHMGGEIFEFVPGGHDQQCVYKNQQNTGPNAPPPGCRSASGCTPSLDASVFYSTRGGMIFDLSGATPVLYLRDGTKFIMNGSTQSAWNDPENYPSTNGTTFVDYGPSKSISPNGEVTTYSWVTGAANRSVFQITDSRGRTKSWDPGNEYLKPNAGDTWSGTWTVPGPAGVPQVYTFNWKAISYDPRQAFPELVSDTSFTGFCTDSFNSTFDQCAPRVVPVITSIRRPDGRTHAFQYGPWVNLTQATDEDGKVTQWDWGDPTSNLTAGDAFVRAFVYPVYSRPQNGSDWNYRWAVRMQSRAPVAARVYPLGLSGPVYPSSRSSYCDLVAGTDTSTPGGGCRVYWTRIVRADGSIEKFGNNSGALIPPTVLAHEIWAASGSAPVEATYNGDVSTGATWYTAESTGGAFETDPLLVNARPTKTQSVRDGLLRTETYSYDVAPIQAAGGKSWTWGNNVLTQLTDASGTVLRQTQNIYLTNSAYTGIGLSHLPLSTRVLDGAGNVVSRRDFAYDETARAASGEAGLDASFTGSARGNLTTTITYTDPVNAPAALVGNGVFPTTGGPLATTASFYDNGAVYRTQTPNDRAAGRYTTTTTFQNAGNWQCASSPQVTVVQSNALGHTTSSVSDCYTGAILSVADPNGAKTCNQFDWLGRLVETAQPGDTLTALPTALTANSCSVTSIPLCGATCNSCTVCQADPTCTAPPTDPCTAGRNCTNWAKSVAMTNDCWDCGSTQNTCAVSDPSTCGVAAGGFVRDPGCATSAGSAVGNGGAGPTSWIEYYPFGVGGTTYYQARTISHSKDGTASGHFTKSFADGLGHTFETCTKIDPATSAGAGTNNEVCTYLTYDSMGRVAKTATPFYATNVTSAAASAPAVPYSQSCYDAISRVTGSAFIWSGAWTCGSSPPATAFATSTSFGVAGANWVTTVTDPNGNQSQSRVNLLGQTIEIDQYKCAGSPCTTATGTPLVTTMAYDVMGHLLQTTDPAGNVARYGYDGLGRKVSMSDPDMGSWSYAYDGNGNVVSQTDARKQTIAIYYDALNRAVVKDLPPAGPGPEDEISTYDGALPTCAPMPCASAWTAGNFAQVCCDDRNPATADSCDPATVTCNARASSVVNACTPGATRTVACNACGNETDTCGPDGQWVLGACAGSSSTQRTVACGACGTETDTCSPTGTWTAGACTGSPTTTRTIACGLCGSETDTCSSTGTWTAGACSGQGVCAPGSQRSLACGTCGSETDTCSASCQWTAGACVSQGVCTPGTTVNLGACSDANGYSGSSIETCGSTCQYGAATCVTCTPGATAACDDQGVCSSCSGTCRIGHHTCSSAGTWGACTGALCSGGCTTRICTQ